MAHSFEAQLREIEKFKEEFDDFHATPCKKSEEGYYKRKRKKSYTINSNTRGRALIICMTEDRDGWEHDVRTVRQKLSSLNIQNNFDSYLFNPTRKELKEKLHNFAISTENDSIDVAVLVVMAHGCQQQTDICIQLKQDGTDDMLSMFSLFEECSLILSRQKSRLRGKPKLKIVQCCRGRSSMSQSTLPVQPLLYDKDDEIDLQRAKVEPVNEFRHYVFLSATEPGLLAPRGTDGSPFIHNIHAALHEYSHDNNVVGVFTKMKQEKYEGEHSLPNPNPVMTTDSFAKLNLFPGITKDTIDKYTQLQVEADPERELQNDQPEDHGAGGVGQNPTGTTPTQTGGNPADTSSQTNPGESAGNPLSPVPCSEESLEENYHRSLCLSTMGRRDCLLDVLSDTYSLSQELSEEVDGPIDVTGIKDGSIILEVVVHGLRTLQRLKYMSDKNILTSFFKQYIVDKTQGTNSAGCESSLKYAYLQMASDEPGYDRKIQMADVFAWTGESIQIQSNDIDMNANWKKDDAALTFNERILLEQTEGGQQVKLVIKNACVEDSGMYTCVFTRSNSSDRLILACVVHVDDFAGIKVTDSGTSSKETEELSPSPSKRPKLESEQHRKTEHHIITKLETLAMAKVPDFYMLTKKDILTKTVGVETVMRSYMKVCGSWRHTIGESTSIIFNPKVKRLKPVRIAIVDSGVNSEHPALACIKDRITCCESVILEASGTNDVYGRGTELLSEFSQLFERCPQVVEFVVIKAVRDSGHRYAHEILLAVQRLLQADLEDVEIVCIPSFVLSHYPPAQKWLQRLMDRKIVIETDPFGPTVIFKKCKGSLTSKSVKPICIGRLSEIRSRLLFKEYSVQDAKPKWFDVDAYPAFVANLCYEESKVNSWFVEVKHDESYAAPVAVFFIAHILFQLDERFKYVSLGNFIKIVRPILRTTAGMVRLLDLMVVQEEDRIIDPDQTLFCGHTDFTQMVLQACNSFL